LVTHTYKQLVIPYLENDQHKKVVKVVEHLPIKCEALSSNSSATKKHKILGSSFTALKIPCSPSSSSPFHLWQSHVPLLSPEFCLLQNVT
jgi:hypothetical protein